MPCELIYQISEIKRKNEEANKRKMKSKLSSSSNTSDKIYIVNIITLYIQIKKNDDSVLILLLFMPCFSFPNEQTTQVCTFLFYLGDLISLLILSYDSNQQKELRNLRYDLMIN